jgi:hypothetical protein
MLLSGSPTRIVSSSRDTGRLWRGRLGSTPVRMASAAYAVPDEIDRAPFSSTDGRRGTLGRRSRSGRRILRIGVRPTFLLPVAGVKCEAAGLWRHGRLWV